MVFDRPPKPGQSRPNQNRLQDRRSDRTNPPTNNQPIETSPWLNPECPPNPMPGTSFVEYLRWMRPYDERSPYNNLAKAQLLQLAEADVNYHDQQKMCDRITRIAGQQNTFEVTCPWRIRVGGIRGPESILLPAFDAVGLPYLPASTLRGVARTQAIRALMQQENLSWQAANLRVSPWFGSLEAEDENQTGKVIFLDAYVLPKSNSIGLTMDIANSIWTWNETDLTLNYKPNPNDFFSLKQVTFLIGLRPTQPRYSEELAQVKRWLIDGLQTGVGSQVNSGYGELQHAGASTVQPFLQLEFELKGQGIHGNQKFQDLNRPYQRENGQWKRNKRNEFVSRRDPQPEVRSIAFKSMLRYWFRAIATGILASDRVRDWESTLFGSITPKPKHGWIMVKVVETPSQETNVQRGCLMISHSLESPNEQHTAIATLFDHLVWLMFHLGGVGQGARRAYYPRPGSSPPIRGTQLRKTSEIPNWEAIATPDALRVNFQNRLRGFYTALVALQAIQNYPDRLRPPARQVRPTEWIEALDENCAIVVLPSRKDNDKPSAQALLHQKFHELENDRRFTDAKNLCGGAKTDRYQVGNRMIERKAIPSPIWIADLEAVQVITIFGVTQNPRRDFLQQLRNAETVTTVFPFSLRS